MIEEAKLKAERQSEELRLEEERKKAAEEAKLVAASQTVQGDTQEQESVQVAFGAGGLKGLRDAHEKYRLSQRGEEDYKTFVEDDAQTCYQSFTHQKDQEYFIIKDGGDEIKMPSIRPGFKTNKPVPNLDPEELKKLNPHISEEGYEVATKRSAIDKYGNVAKDVKIEIISTMGADGEFKCSEITFPPTATLNAEPELQLFTDWQAKQGEGKKKDLQTFLVEKHAEIDWDNIIITAPSKSRSGEMVNICTGQELGRIMRDMHPEIAQSLEQGHGAAVRKPRQDVVESKIVVAEQQEPKAQSSIVIDESVGSQQHNHTPRSHPSQIILSVTSPEGVDKIIAQTRVVNTLRQSANLSPSSSIIVNQWQGQSHSK
jgi:hypothetical protein